MAKKKVIVSLLTKDQEFQLLQAADAESAAARAGLELEVVYGKNNSTLQLEQLYRFVNAPDSLRPVAIVVQSVGGDGLPRAARDAVKAGIGWILLNRDVPYIDSLRSEYPRLPIAIVTTDHREVGRIQGRQCRKLLPSGGHILYIQGPPDTSAARERLLGMQESIAGANIELKTLDGDWTESSGEHAVTGWLRLASSQQHAIHLVAAQNDAMAIGARKAIAARRPEWAGLPFAGCDGLPQGGQRLVREGQLAATVIVQSNTGPAIGLVAAHLEKGAAAPARLVLNPAPYPA